MNQTRMSETVAVDPEQVADVLEAAADYIDEHGWMQGDFENHKGQVCALGAIQRVTSSMRQLDRQVDPLHQLTFHAELVLEHEVSSLPIWNDEPGRGGRRTVAHHRETGPSWGHRGDSVTTTIDGETMLLGPFSPPTRRASPGTSTPTRLAMYIDCPDVGRCWNWMGTRNSHGYGAINLQHRQHSVHRVVYELLVGPIPDGLQLDHLCRNRACCNPAHLEPVSNRENGLRGVSPPAINAAKTHCHRGHPFDELNTRRHPSRPSQRYCRTCRRERDALRHAARRGRA